MSRQVHPARIFYFAPVMIGVGSSENCSPAVRNKVLGVLRALQVAGVATVLVSTIGGPKLVSPIRMLHAGSMDGFDTVQVYAPGRAVVRRIVSMITLLVATILLIRRRDRVVLYNFFPEYILAAIWLRIAGIVCIMDIEDAPREDEPGVRGAVTRCSFRLLSCILIKRYLIVSDKLAKELGLFDYLTVYGVASHFVASENRLKPFSMPEIRINFGGALLRDTGIELFEAALRILAKEHSDKPLHFFITGHVPQGFFDSVGSQLSSSSALSLTVASELDMASYRALLDTIDVGLCLKLPSTEMGQTTFPSKVVEIAALGLLLISTRVSDVPLIFSDESAMLLLDEDPRELAEILASLPIERLNAAKRAQYGQQIVQEKLSALSVGTAICKFLRV